MSGHDRSRLLGTSCIVRRSVRRTTLLSASLFAVLLVGCDSAPAPANAAPTAPAILLDGSNASRAVVAKGKQEDVVAVAAAFDAAWNVGDATALAALYADDAEFISILGIILPNAMAIRAQHAFLFAGPFRGSRSASVVRRVTFLTGTTAMLDLDTQLTGYVALSPGIRPTEPGVLRARFKHIVEKRDGRWLITATQSTAIQPPL